MLRPGTMTLLLAPPGHGKTSFLRAVAGQCPGLKGTVTYGGLTREQLEAQGMYLKLLANYVDQLDTHLPFLTVRETAQFACTNSTVDPSVLGHPMLAEEAANRVDRVLKLLNLEGCANTLVGNNLVRGVSGGEKKRVTIAEALVSNARLLCMDEISTGLDASVAYDICASIRAWAQEMRGTVVIALLQPTPEVYGLFDDVLLMREGSVIYHGDREALPGYLAKLGFAHHEHTGHSDTADWLVELLASPTKLLRKAGAPLSSAPRTTAALVSAWTGSPECAARLEAPAEERRLELVSDFAKRQYGQPYPRSAATHFKALLERAFRVTARNGLFVSARIMSAVIISMILGTVWFKLSLGQEMARFGMLLFCVMQVSFANFSEIPFAVQYKFVAYKHIQSGMYPAWGEYSRPFCVGRELCTAASDSRPRCAFRLQATRSPPPSCSCPPRPSRRARFQSSSTSWWAW